MCDLFVISVTISSFGICQTQLEANLSVPLEPATSLPSFRMLGLEPRRSRLVRGMSRPARRLAGIGATMDVRSVAATWPSTCNGEHNARVSGHGSLAASPRATASAEPELSLQLYTPP
jgi:hypothetical protein